MLRAREPHRLKSTIISQHLYFLQENTTQSELVRKSSSVDRVTTGEDRKHTMMMKSSQASKYKYTRRNERLHSCPHDYKSPTQSLTQPRQLLSDSSHCDPLHAQVQSNETITFPSKPSKLHAPSPCPSYHQPAS